MGKSPYPLRGSDWTTAAPTTQNFGRLGERTRAMSVLYRGMGLATQGVEKIHGEVLGPVAVALLIGKGERIMM